MLRFISDQNGNWSGSGDDICSNNNLVDQKGRGILWPNDYFECSTGSITLSSENIGKFLEISNIDPETQCPYSIIVTTKDITSIDITTGKHKEV